jgi:hypothetical protein
MLRRDDRSGMRDVRSRFRYQRELIGAAYASLPGSLIILSEKWGGECSTFAVASVWLVGWL